MVCFYHPSTIPILAFPTKELRVDDKGVEIGDFIDTFARIMQESCMTYEMG